MNPGDGEPRGRILILGLPYFGNMLAKDLSGLGWKASFLAHPTSWSWVAAPVSR